VKNICGVSPKTKNTDEVFNKEKSLKEKK